MERRAITVRGMVQGVGFRPFVHGLASRLQLSGFVRNQSGVVYVEVEGPSAALEQFLDELPQRAPRLAQIDEISWQTCDAVGDRTFRIVSSRDLDVESLADIRISPDIAPCEACLAELFDPADRRYRYPFLNCTNCGPRLTIIESAPYDRERTTMASFALCPACSAEYHDPTNRRFHAQPTACPACGPRLEIVDAAGKRVTTDDPLAHFVRALQAGGIGALKGLGGYHLVCDAADEQAVARLRQRKQRDEKPFAVMVRDVAAARELCRLDPQEEALLTSSRRPIVLLARADASRVAPAVAPRNPWLGIMLPYTPLHHLLMDAVDGHPLVMTSGNRNDEPIAYRDDDALRRLAGIADVYLRHNRPIHVRCDDSVTRVVAHSELPVRRSRGYAPQSIELSLACAAPLLAVGGQLKGTFALGVGHRAILSHHLGDLDHLDAYQAFERDILLYEQLFQLRPELIVHDLHPDYASTHYAERRAAEQGIPRLAVQHHHAHLASCMVDNGLNQPVIGVTFDGTGFGDDEWRGASNDVPGPRPAIWGGEFLVGDYHAFRRAARLRYVPMPGGERAVREPWRMALSHLADAGYSAAMYDQRISCEELKTIRAMIDRGLHAPPTSSAGRLFDAVASITGVCDRASYEGQPAVQLEWLADTVPADRIYPFDISGGSSAPDGSYRAGEGDSNTVSSLSDTGSLVIDTRPLIRAVHQDALHGVSAARVARRFHDTMTAMIVATCQRIRRQTGLDAVVLSGGVFMNVRLTEGVLAELSAAGFRVYRHRHVPPNDGGLCLGQLAIAAAYQQRRRAARSEQSQRQSSLMVTSAAAPTVEGA